MPPFRVEVIKNNYRLLISGIALGALISAPANSFAQTGTVQITASGMITQLLSDWNSNALLVALDPSVPFSNPANCPMVDLYETNPDDAGVSLNHSLLLSVYMSHATVALVIQGCSFNGRPHIASVRLPR